MAERSLFHDRPSVRVAAVKPSEWAMAKSRELAAVSSAIRRIDAEGFAFILDAAREEGRRAGLEEAAKWVADTSMPGTVKARTWAAAVSATLLGLRAPPVRR